MRGKPLDAPPDAAIGGLIPAHAGKTPSGLDRGRHPRAHPRSCGENLRLYGLGALHEGSSPLMRGKLENGRTYRVVVGLIPAHAGKTRARPAPGGESRAHPRSCGENCYNTNGNKGVTGSSPLMRGKLGWSVPSTHGRGLIPAHAGKTSRRAGRRSRRGAHPRSCGENSDPAYGRALSMGSSPLMRGKRLAVVVQEQRRGLIPAHAGKTPPRSRSPRGAWAHPRSCGENV